MSKNLVLLRSKKKKALALIQEGKFEQAKAQYLLLSLANSKDPEIWFMLGAINGQLGLLEEVIVCSQKVLGLKPDHIDAQYNLAQAYMHQGDLEKAVIAYRRVLQLDSNHAEAYNNLGCALERLGNTDEAKRCYQSAIQVVPLHTGACTNMGNLLFEQNSLHDAIHFYQQALRGSPHCVKALHGIGQALYHHGKVEDALQYFDVLLTLDANDIGGIVGKAMVFDKQGAFDQAYALLSPLYDRGVTDAGFALAFCEVARHFSRQKDAISLLESVLTRDTRIGLVNELLHRQLGKLYDEAGQYDQAFLHYDRSNTLKKTYCTDPALDIRNMNEIMGIFTRDFMSRMPRAGHGSSRPVFIVGMPRSGTTLIEQILSSHSQVFGAGELTEIEWITHALPEMLGNTAIYPHGCEGVTAGIADQAARRYLSLLSSLAPTALRVTDKMPMNFKHLGLIQILFPDARIIHCTRNPLDTCLSIYTHEFNEKHAYTADLKWLGEYYRKYQEVMRHWQAVLTIPILEVNYEEVVRNPEAITRTLLAFCDLEWDEQCLRFYENKRVVNTPSYDQVRRPIYKNSVERWRHYEHHLGPLKTALGMS